MDEFSERAWGKTHAWPDRAIAALAARQRALVTYRQLIALGASRTAIAGAVRRGRLHRIHHGVYALVPAAVLPALALEQAALLACGPRALLSHRTAAALWGVLDCAAGCVEVTIVGGDAGRRRSGIAVHRVRALDRRDVRRHERLPLTAPARTLLDNAPSLPDRQLERAFDEALARRLTSRTALREMLARHPTRAGAPRLRALLEEGRAPTFTRSEAEERLLNLLRLGGLPAPECNATLGRFEVDFLWRRERVVLEVDGYAFHAARRCFEADRRRDNELHAAGFHTIRVTWRQLTREPEAVLVWTAAAIARREPP
jgi:very-short-patch-repair endonuclease